MFFLLTLIASIAAGVAIGTLVANAITMTIGWLKNKIAEKLRQKNAKKVAVGAMKKLLEEAMKSENVVKLDDLGKMVQNGCEYVIATIDDDGNAIGDIEFFEDLNEDLDAEVDRLLGRKGLVVVEV